VSGAWSLSASTPSVVAERCRLARTREELDDHFAVRRAVFVVEQRLFADDDRDERDRDAVTLHAIGVVGEAVAGAVRLYPLDARGRESVTERFIHGEILKARPEIMAVVHNHSPSVVPFSVTGVPMRALWHMAAFIGDGLPNWEIRDVRKGTDLLVRDAQLGASLAKTLGPKPAALMRGHGSVTVGESLPRAVGRSVYLELSARMQMQALALSQKVNYLDEAEVKASTPLQDYKRAWPMWREKALARAKAERK